jgi:hypothetical protein
MVLEPVADDFGIADVGGLFTRVWVNANQHVNLASDELLAG